MHISVDSYLGYMDDKIGRRSLIKMKKQYHPTPISLALRDHSLHDPT
jgi:hypothetical protein